MSARTPVTISTLRGNAGEGTRVRRGVRMALLIALVVRTLLLQAFKIPSSSMENTLLVGDHILSTSSSTDTMCLHKGRILRFSTRSGGHHRVRLPGRHEQGFHQARHRAAGRHGGDPAENRPRQRDPSKSRTRGSPTDGRRTPRADTGHPASRAGARGKLFVMGTTGRSYDSASGIRGNGRGHREGAVHLLFHRLEQGVGWTEVWRYPNSSGGPARARPEIVRPSP